MSANPNDAGARPTPERAASRIGPDLWPRVAAAVVMGLIALWVAWTGGIVFIAWGEWLVSGEWLVVAWWWWWLVVVGGWWLVGGGLVVVLVVGGGGW